MKATPSKFKLGLIQMSCGVGVEENLQKALSLIGQAAQRGAQIICLQELFRSQYFCQKQEAVIFDLAEPIPGPSTEALAASARQNQVAIVGSLFERRDAGVYHNTAVVLDADGSLLGTYRKMHIPDDPLYYEKYYFTPGDQGYRSFDTRYGRIGVLVCWDQWYPEGARLTALQGAKVLLYPTAIGGTRPKQYGAHNTMPGEQFNVPMPLLMGLRGCRGTAWGTKALLAVDWFCAFRERSFGVVLAVNHRKILVVDRIGPSGSVGATGLPARSPHRQLRANREPID
jgi:hypothetical protein